MSVKSPAPQFSNAADLILDEIENTFGLKYLNGRPKTTAALIAILEFFCEPKEIAADLPIARGCRSQTEIRRLREILKIALSGEGAGHPLAPAWCEQLAVCDWLLGEDSELARMVQAIIDGCDRSEAEAASATVPR